MRRAHRSAPYFRSLPGRAKVECIVYFACSYRVTAPALN